MGNDSNSLDNRALDKRVVLITGAAHRIGATTARLLHAAGMNIVLHYRNSASAAEALQQELEKIRPDSVALIQADLHQTTQLNSLIQNAASQWGRLDVLINNASTFYQTPVGSITESDWNDLMGSNLKAPLFLSQAAAPYLSQQNGSIINMVDIHANRPLREYPLYSIAKAGLAMLTKTMARELGPDVRVNGVAPGAILWPEDGMDDSSKEDILSRTALKRSGEPSDIAYTILFLIRDASYITGQVLNVDGGRTLSN